jgi:hypothetical protein
MSIVVERYFVPVIEGVPQSHSPQPESNLKLCFPKLNLDDPNCGYEQVDISAQITPFFAGLGMWEVETLSTVERVDGGLKVVRNKRDMTQEERDEKAESIRNYFVNDFIPTSLARARELKDKETDETLIADWERYIAELENFVVDPYNLIIPSAPKLIRITQ